MIGEQQGIPVRLRWDARHLEVFDLGGLLAPSRTEKAACARQSMVASILLEAAGQDRPHYYSRRRNHYAEVGRLVIKAIDLYNQGLGTEALVAITSVGNEIERGNANIRFANELAR